MSREKKTSKNVYKSDRTRSHIETNKCNFFSSRASKSSIFHHFHNRIWMESEWFLYIYFVERKSKKFMTLLRHSHDKFLHFWRQSIFLNHHHAGLQMMILERFIVILRESLLKHQVVVYLCEPYVGLVVAKGTCYSNLCTLSSTAFYIFLHAHFFKRHAKEIAGKNGEPFLNDLLILPNVFFSPYAI